MIPILSHALVWEVDMAAILQTLLNLKSEWHADLLIGNGDSGLNPIFVSISLLL